MTPIHAFDGVAQQVAGGGLAERRGVAIRLTAFDQRAYLQLIEARGATIRRIVARLGDELGLATALDVGCGVGFFAKILRECGLTVGGFDGRMANIEEARRRFPEIAFEQGDIESERITSLGSFDLTLCFGLLYHLENPMLAIRHLRELTGKGLLLESMCVPGEQAGMVMREEPRQDDQSLTEIALYPSEGCLVKMLYRAGFGGVYKVAELPDHDDFRETPDHARRRTVLFASVTPMRLAGFTAYEEPGAGRDLWAKSVEELSRPQAGLRVKRFATLTLRQKYISMALRARRVLPNAPIPLRLGFSAWWLAEDSALDRKLLAGEFEDAELRFVERALQPGMTGLDAGAHHGLYTLLMSKRVGAGGKVIAVEPSPRERKRLTRHVRINRCKNVQVEGCALGSEQGGADLFLVEGEHDWCNSLRPPAIDAPTHAMRVETRRLDDVLEDSGISQVDFIKLDVEGAELSVLRGSSRILEGMRRPVILAEVQDIRTKAWGYEAREIVEFLRGMKYRWFALTMEGTLQEIWTQAEEWDVNLVAMPEERVDEFAGLIA